MVLVRSLKCHGGVTDDVKYRGQEKFYVKPEWSDYLNMQDTLDNNTQQLFEPYGEFFNLNVS